jgi:RNA polymerase sigma factor (sigma-70 family)
MPRPEAHDLTEMLEHATWIRSLASALAQDPSTADDLVQGTWMAALEKPPGRSVPMKIWLAAVLRNLARDKHRADVRRSDREEVAARPEATPSVHESTEAIALQRALFEAVAALDEPYRDVIFQRYYEGLPPRRIAERTGVPVKTVSTRLHRALERLRAELDHRYAGDRRRWMATLIGLATKRSRPGIPLGTIGTVLMSTSSKIALAIVALACTAWFLRQNAPPDRVASATVTPSDDTPHESNHASTGPVDESPPQARVAAAEVASIAKLPPNSGALRAEFTWDNGSPATGIGVLLSRTLANETLVEFERTTGPDGVVHEESLTPGKMRVTTDRSHEVEFATVNAGEQTVLHFVIPRGVGVRGRVVDSHGDPVAGAGIWLSWGSAYHLGHIAKKADSDGRFTLDSIAPGQLGQELGARSNGYAPSLLHEVSGRAGDVVDVELHLPSRGGAVTGHVLSPEGAAVAGARVAIGNIRPFNVQLPDGSSGKAAPAARVATDKAGLFTAEGVGQGENDVEVSADGLATWRGKVHVSADEVARMDVALIKGAELSGVVRDQGGVAVDKARIDIDVGQWPIILFTDNEGHFARHNMTPGSYHALVDGKSHGRLVATLECRDGDALEWNPVLSLGHTISGKVVDQNDHPLVGWHVSVQPMDLLQRWSSKDWSESWGNTNTDAEGAFAFNSLLAMPQRIEVRRPREYSGHPLLALEDQSPDQQGIVLRIGERQTKTGVVRGLIVSPEGTPVGDAEVVLLVVGGASASGVHSDQGSGHFEMQAPAGIYRVEVHAKGCFFEDQGSFDLKAGDVHDLGTITLGRAGSLCVGLSRSRGGEIGMPHLSLRGMLGEPVGSLLLDGDKACCGNLKSGEYLLLFQSGNSAPSKPWIGPDGNRMTVMIRPGEETRLEVDLDQAPK